MTVDLSAIQANYHVLAERVSPSICAAVVKADAYGLGAAAVARALHDVGCRAFFVATADEGIALRESIPHDDIYVLEGCLAAKGAQLVSNSLIPVLNCADEVSQYASNVGNHRLPCVLQVDTGMTRFGLSETDLRDLLGNPSMTETLDIRYLMTHFACADNPGDEMNAAQLEALRRFSNHLPEVTTSLANSFAAFLPARYHGGLVRAGISLYGGNPTRGLANPMRDVTEIQARVLQVHNVEQHCRIGYGGTGSAEPGDAVATVALGYADGYRRTLSNRAQVWFDGIRLPVAGRISMDSFSIRIPKGTETRPAVGDWVTVLGGDITIDELADWAGTISYEILTGIGTRVERRYKM